MFNNTAIIGNKLHILTKYQYFVLTSYFERDPYWGKDTVTAASAQLNLNRAKVLKWGSDKKRSMIKKMNINKYPQQTSPDCIHNIKTFKIDELDIELESIQGCDGSIYEENSANKNLNIQVDEIIDLCQSSTNSHLKQLIKRSQDDEKPIESQFIDMHLQKNSNQSDCKDI